MIGIGSAENIVFQGSELEVQGNQLNWFISSEFGGMDECGFPAFQLNDMSGYNKNDDNNCVEMYSDASVTLSPTLAILLAFCLTINLFVRVYV